MKSFHSFITEARRNPKQNPKQAPYYALEQYNKPGYYATYITDPKSFETNTKKQNEDERADSPAVILNTKSKYMTPWGIYTYSMLDMYKEYPPPSESGEQVFRVPFAGEKPWIALIQKTPECRTLNTASYKSNDLTKDLPNIRHDILQLMQKKHGKDYQKTQSLDFFNDIVAFAKHLAKSKRVAGKLWNITRMSGFLVQKSWDEISKLFAKEEETIISALKKFTPKPTLWATIFRRAPGKKFYYDLVDDPGLGVIHENEPRQAVFFSRKGYKVVKIIPNKDVEYNEKHSSTKFAKREGELETHIRRGKNISEIPREKYPDLVRILTKKDKDKKTLLDKKKMTQKLPPIVEKEILDKDLDYYDQMIDVDHKSLMLSLARNISPKEVRDFLIDHSEIKFSQEDLNNLVQRRPQNLSAILHLNPSSKTIIDVIKDDPINVHMLTNYDIPIESKKQYKIPVEVQEAFPAIFDKVFTGETKSKGSKTLQSLRDDRAIRMLKNRILDLVHTNRLSAKVSNALVNVLDKNNQLSDAEKIQLKNK
tara:strand:+ start:595 stop:2205 length:1611 start_codon:yes stop_codon:yes gene_type:complete